MYRFPGFWPGELLGCPYISVEERYRDIQMITKRPEFKKGSRAPVELLTDFNGFRSKPYFLMKVALPNAFFS
jgi:hypothetical protein